ncbi:hypothetical protein KCU95_g10333, partial [Aureobasidium melanogenum]
MSVFGNHICGCYYTTSFYNRTYLPQVHLDSHTTITPLYFTTKLSQTFHNPSGDQLPETRYTFPLYDGVAVSSFTCTVGEKVIKGHVEQKEQARKTFDAAVSRGETAGLLESLPTGVFGVTLGNVPADASIQVDITYGGELKHDAQIDGLRYNLPTSIAPRYGNYPGELLNLDSAIGKGMKITVDIDMQGSTGSYINNFLRDMQLVRPCHLMSLEKSVTFGGSEARTSARLNFGTLVDMTSIMEVKETADVAKTADITKTGDETQNATETQTQNIKALKDAVAVLDPERLEELRWFKHAEKVISSNFLRHPKESDDSWLDRLLYPAQTMKQLNCPLDIIISKLRTTIEANGRKTPTLRRIKFVIWLGLLTRDWLEAETLKWIANQEYLLYQCRGYKPDEDTGLWLSALGRVTEKRTPQEVHEELFLRLKELEESLTEDFDDAELRNLICQPDEWHCEPKCLPNKICPSRKRQSQSEEIISRGTRLETELLKHLAFFEELEPILGLGLRKYGVTILARRDQIAAYTQTYNNAVYSFLHDRDPTCKYSDLQTMLKIIKLAKSGEEEDMEYWRRTYTWLQSVQITMARLQKQLIAKRKNNHNRNKNKNRALKKKLLKDESKDSEAGTDEVAEQENEEDDSESEEDEADDDGAEEYDTAPCLPQDCIGSASAGVTRGFQMLEDLERSLKDWGRALDRETARAHGTATL